MIKIHIPLPLGNTPTAQAEIPSGPHITPNIILTQLDQDPIQVRRSTTVQPLLPAHENKPTNIHRRGTVRCKLSTEILSRPVDLFAKSFARSERVRALVGVAGPRGASGGLAAVFDVYRTTGAGGIEGASLRDGVERDELE